MKLNLDPHLANIPECLHERLINRVDSFNAGMQKVYFAFSDKQQAALMASLPRVWAISDFIAQNCVQTPTILWQLVVHNDLHTSFQSHEYRHRLSNILNKVNDLDELMTALRQFRLTETIRIAWRDLACLSTFEETSRDLSNLADACIDLAAQRLYFWRARKHGNPKNKHKQAQSLLIIALGKLGSRELNFSSDVDLLLAYPEAGFASADLDNEAFFLRLSQNFIKCLNSPTADGFVYRVDTRLRPYGDSGPLLMNYHGLECYYQEVAREWERYPLIKARLVSGDVTQGKQLLQLFRGFAYRPYVDYSIVETLREMKMRIIQEVERKRLHNNIKLGAGGIREIEFIVQSQQLISGGRDQRLRARELLPVLNHLSKTDILNPKIAKSLKEHYVFLRNTENRLQMFSDRQVHTLPTDTIEQARLAYSMGYDDWDGFNKALSAKRDFVHHCFQQQISKPKFTLSSADKTTHQDDFTKIWQTREASQALTLLDKVGFADNETAWQLLQGLQAQDAYQQLRVLFHERFDELMPMLLTLIAVREDNLTCLRRVLGVMEAILKQRASLSLLLENPKICEPLVALCAASPWITDQIRSFPMLLNELRNTRKLYAPLAEDELDSELRQLLIALPVDDLPQQMDALREFSHAQILRVAAADVTGALPVMKVSDHLTFTACVIVRRVLTIALKHVWQSFNLRAHPASLDDACGFAIVAYGKLGGIELGYGSDLDLVFLYDEAHELMTDTKEPVDKSQFYARLAQQIIHILGASTSSGVLYKIDTRLRPSGNAGLLATGLKAFASYQLEQAWTWEHQAMVRARVIAGSEKLAKQFANVREQVLSIQREPEKLRQDVLEMHSRIQQAAKPAAKDEFMLKHGPGGITDIEFIVQYAVLHFAAEHPTLYQYPDNIRILEALGKEALLSNEEAELLGDAYRAYRSEMHRLDLQNAKSFVPMAKFSNYRALVTRVWQRFFGEKI